MTLYIKGTDTIITGTLESIVGQAYLNGLEDDGSISYEGSTEVYWDDQTTATSRSGQPVWMDDDGNEHRDIEVEDRRDDGTVVAFAPWPARPFTAVICSAWRGAVTARQTERGLEHWVNALSDEAYLRTHGLYLAERDPLINMLHKGAWQVAEHYAPGTKTEDASDGPWAVVGDDKDQLVAEALAQIRAFHE